MRKGNRPARSSRRSVAHFDGAANIRAGRNDMEEVKDRGRWFMFAELEAYPTLIAEAKEARLKLNQRIEEIVDDAPQPNTLDRHMATKKALGPLYEECEKLTIKIERMEREFQLRLQQESRPT
jgi:hypothetical protein